jgi:hypothetical protein
MPSVAVLPASPFLLLLFGWQLPVLPERSGAIKRLHAPQENRKKESLELREGIFEAHIKQPNP